MVIIMHLGEDAFSTTIRNEAATRARKKITVGSLWVSLDNLVSRGFIRKKTVANPNGKGGRPKVYYKLTKSGTQALKRTRLFQEKLWKGVIDLDTYAF